MLLLEGVKDANLAVCVFEDPRQVGLKGGQKGPFGGRLSLIFDIGPFKEILRVFW